MEVKHIIETAENKIERKTAKLFEKEVKQIAENKAGENTENEGKEIEEKVLEKIMEKKVANILELEDNETIRTAMAKILHLEANEISETPAAEISQMQACNTSKREVYRIPETTKLCDSCKVKFTERSYQEDQLPAEFPPYESTCKKCLNRNTIFDNLDKQPTHTVAKLHFSGNKQISLEETLDITKKINFLKVSKTCTNLEISDINTTMSNIDINPSTSGTDTNKNAYNININPSTCDSDSPSKCDSDSPSTCDSDSTSVYDDDINLNACGVDIDQNACDVDIDPSTYDADINSNTYNTGNQSTYDTNINSSSSCTNINQSTSNIVIEHMFGKSANGSKDSLQSYKNFKQNERTKTSSSESSFEVQEECRSNNESYRRDTSFENSSEEIEKSRQTYLDENLHANVCENCNKYFSRISSLTDHILNCDKENIKKSKKFYSAQEPYKCFHCPKCFKNEESLQKHLETCRKHVMANSDELLKNEGVQQLYTCQACNNEFNSRGSLDYHLKKCKQLYALQCAIQSHNSEKPIICVACTKRFKVESSLEMHKSKCKKRFIVKPPLKLEQQDISENESHKYKVFKGEYTKERVLSRPQDSDVNALYHFPKTKTAGASKKQKKDSRVRKPFLCTYPKCRKRFETESACRQHRLSHNSKRSCQNCVNSFDNLHDYDAHKPECSQKWKKTPSGTCKTTYFPDT